MMFKYILKYKSMQNYAKYLDLQGVYHHAAHQVGAARLQMDSPRHGFADLLAN